MEELRIQTALNPQYFSEFYFQNGQGSLFSYQQFKDALIILSLLIAITLAAYLLSLSFPYTVFSVLFAVGLLGIAGAIIYAGFIMVKYFRWKATVQRFLKELRTYTTQNIIATTNSIEVLLDAKSSIEKWENITAVQYDSNYIILFKQDIPLQIFPARSMQPNEFESLKMFIREKVK